MGLYSMARSVNAKRKQYIKRQAGKVLSPVRRIERVHPPRTGRVVAMTFDDGPCAGSFSGGKRGLTEELLEILREAGATASFDVIGTTAENYPDRQGDVGSVQFGGVRYDHYPCFGRDALAGVVNQPELVRKILAGGHELTNHSYSHRLFGPKRVVYRRREHMQSLQQVTEDLVRLHDYVREQFGYEMKLARPPHYVDHIPGGTTSYDAYRIMGYQYMAASFDGGGWQPLDSYAGEVRQMVQPLRQLLECDAGALSGQIIFQKDGCNMNLRAPVLDALPQQLRLLRQYGYQVVSVSELLELSPFEDLAPDSRAMPYVQELLRQGHIVGYQNNTFQGEKAITPEEFLLMAARPERLRTQARFSPHEIIRESKRDLGVDLQDASGKTLLDLAWRRGIEVDEAGFKDKKAVKREDAAPLLAALARQTVCAS